MRTAVISVVAWAVVCSSALAQSRQLMTFEEAKQRADNGDAFAQAVVALHYQLGWNTEKSPELAAKYARASANAGEPLGQFRLGALLRAGEGVAKDERQGLAYQAASFNGLNAAQDPYSMTAAGIMIFQGKVIGQNISQDTRRKDAAALYKKSADQGYAPAQFNYAMCAEAGHGIPKDLQLRDSYIRKAESKEYPLAVQWLREQSPQTAPPAASLLADQTGITSNRTAFVEQDLYGESQDTGGIVTVVQEAPVEPRFVALSKDGHVLAAVSDKVVHCFEAATGRLLRKISFHDRTGKVGKRIYAASHPSEFYLVLADDFSEPSETEECFALNYLTGKLRRISLPLGSQVVGSSPTNNALAIYEASGQNATLTELEVDSSRVVRRVVLPPAWREIVRAIYNQDGQCGLVSLAGGEVVSLDSLTLISPSGELRIIEPGNETAQTLARLLSFSPTAVAPYRNDGSIKFFTDVYGIKVGKKLFDFEQSSLWSTSSGIMVRNGKDFAYLLALSDPLECRLSGLGLAVDGVGCSSDGRFITAWSVGFKTPSVFRQDGKLNTEPPALRADQEAARAFVYDSLLTTYSPIFIDDNQVWNAAISEDGGSVALATSQVKSNSTPSSEFYGSGTQWPEVPSIEANAVLLNPWTGEVLGRSGPSAIYPFVYAEQWSISPQVALAQTCLEFVKTRFCADFSRWIVNASGNEIRLTDNAGDLRPHYQGWDIQENIRTKSVTDNMTGDCVSWRGSTLQVGTGGSGTQTKESKPISGAYPLGGGKVAVATTEAVQILTDYGKTSETSWQIPGEGLKEENGRPAFQAFAVAPDTKIAYVLAGNHGIHRLSLDDSSINLEATFYPQRGGPPVVVLQDGTYLVRGGAIQGIHFSDGERTYPFEQFDLRLNRPDIVLERLGAPADAVAIAKQLREKRLKRMGVTEEMLKPDFHVPELEIAGDIPATTNASEINLSIKADDSKYPLERLKVFVNNVPVNGRDGELLRDETKTDAGLLGRITGAFSEESTGPQTLERTIPIKLAAGRNKIQVSVLNNAGAESVYANAEVNCTGKRAKPTLYAVAMGVSEYSNPDWNLKYAAKDAKDVLAKLKARAGNNYGEVKELLLTDKEVTKESLAKIREFLKSATIDDTVVMFAAGHGLLDSKYDYYFGTTDIDFNNPADKGIAFEDFDDILADLPCLKKSLLVDTCHAGELDQDEKTLLASADSGGSAALPTGKGIAMRSIGTRGMNVKAIEGARGASEWYDRLQGLFVDLRRGSGSTILSSSAGAEYALESSEQQNGLFTYAVLEALDGKPGADANKDGSVQMSELGEYVKKRVSALTNNKQTPNTRRVNLEGDFALAKTK